MSCGQHLPRESGSTVFADLPEVHGLSLSPFRGPSAPVGPTLLVVFFGVVVVLLLQRLGGAIM